MNVYTCIYMHVIFRYMQKDFIMQGLAKLNEIETTMLRRFIAFCRFISYSRECNFPDPAEDEFAQNCMHITY